jgi:hypothetical protein
VADLLGHFADLLARVLGNLDEILAGRQQLPGEGPGENGIGVVVVVRQPVERGLLIAGL